MEEQDETERDCRTSWNILISVVKWITAFGNI
jgi:hypothetical protein